MILGTLVGAAILLQKPVDIVCPTTGEKVPATATKFDDYAGVRFTYCCPGCEKPFVANPAKALAQIVSKNWVSGKSLFNPVTGARIDEKAAKGFSDYKGVRYFFASAKEKTKFDAAPATYGTMPTKESLTCPVSHEVIAGYANAIAYRNIGGVRYYICCAGCIQPFDKEPARYTAKIKETVKAPAISNPGKSDHDM